MYIKYIFEVCWIEWGICASLTPESPIIWARKLKRPWYHGTTPPNTNLSCVTSEERPIFLPWVEQRKTILLKYLFLFFNESPSSKLGSMVVVFLFNYQYTHTTASIAVALVFELFTSSFYMKWMFNPKTQKQVLKTCCMYRLDNSIAMNQPGIKVVPSLYMRRLPVAKHVSCCTSKSSPPLHEPWGRGVPGNAGPSSHVATTLHLQVMTRKGYGTIEVASRMLRNSIGNGLADLFTTGCLDRFWRQVWARPNLSKKKRCWDSWYVLGQFKYISIYKLDFVTDLWNIHQWVNTPNPWLWYSHPQQMLFGWCCRTIDPRICMFKMILVLVTPNIWTHQTCQRP